MGYPDRTAFFGDYFRVGGDSGVKLSKSSVRQADTFMWCEKHACGDAMPIPSQFVAIGMQ